MLTVRSCAVALLTVALLATFASNSLAEELPLPPPRPSLTAIENLQRVLSLDDEATGSAEQGEPITERYPNGAVKVQRFVIQDNERNYVNHGPWTMLTHQGQVIAQGEYKNGKQHGPWMRVLPEFAMITPGFKAPFSSQAEFDHGKLHGTWTIIDSQQRVVASWQFSQGVLDGAATTWHPNGQQKREMIFAKGVPDGESTAWKPNGQIWAREFYREGKQLVPVVTWHDRRQKESEGWMVRSNFKIHSKVNWWEGTIEITREETEGEDTKTGEWTEWYANGTMKFRGNFESGAAEGRHVWWHPNGQKMLAGVYHQGMQEERWTTWHATGMKQNEGTYIAGNKAGTWTTWAEDGLIADVEHLQEGIDSSRRRESEIVDTEDDDAEHNVSHLLGP